MANAVYPKFREAQLTAASGIDIENGDLRCILVDLADYTYNAAHDMLDDVAAGSRVAVTGALTGVTITNGLLDVSDFSFTAVTGDQAEALIYYLHTGTESTSRLVAFVDTGVTNFPVTPNGGNINVTVHASGVAQF
jgi:hypothetical protein